MKTPAQPRKTVTFTAIRTESGVMNLSLLPTFWQRVAMRVGGKAAAHIIDELKQKIRAEGGLFTIAPLMWTIEVDMPMFYGNTYVYVTPYEGKTD